jgi:ATP-dependent 26S proteasome regulatory subunit
VVVAVAAARFDAKTRPGGDGEVQRLLVELHVLAQMDGLDGTAA